MRPITISDLRAQLNAGVVHFAYYKKNGEYREAFGTTVGSLAEAHTNGKGAPRSNFNCVAYFDIEKGAWRSCKEDSIIGII